MSYLEIRNASIGFGPESHRVNILDDINLDVEKNEFVAIIGFSGSGKSTLMSLLAGLEIADTGGVYLNGKKVTAPSPERGIMFQNYSLLPWLTVYENVELAVRQAFPNYSKAQTRVHVEHYLGMVSLLPAVSKKPRELSGGMRQRVSLARTLSMQPDVLLLDEPLSALDALTRSNIQDEIIRIWEEDKRTVVMITNDVDEALLLADRIIPLTMGPEATLAEAFEVPLSRPRDRATLNTNPQYRKLRTDIANFLIEMNEEAKLLRATTTLKMPDVIPHDFTKVTTKSLRKFKAEDQFKLEQKEEKAG